MSLTIDDVFGRYSLLTPGMVVTHKGDADPLRGPDLKVRTGLVTGRYSATEDEGDPVLMLNLARIDPGRITQLCWPASDVHFCDDLCFSCPRVDHNEARRIMRRAWALIGGKHNPRSVGPARWDANDRQLLELALTMRAVVAG